ncbi:MAG TPA: hypothetical protein DDW87_10445, partial [Firmicutes bacterium]|nr:hypothetical protein [Bacillota bacterium]
GGLVLSLESTSNRMSRLAKGEMDEGAIITPEEAMDRIEGVSYRDVMELAQLVYNPQAWSWVALGPRNLVKGDVQCQKIC